MIARKNLSVVPGLIVAVMFLISGRWLVCAEHSQKLAEGENWTSPATGMEFVWISEMGLWVGKYEVTNEEYRKKEPSHDSRDFQGHTLNSERQPVVFVNFSDGRAYAEWMTQRDSNVLPDGYRYRLPGEDEWMTFAQCGDGREYPWGNNWPPRSGQAGNYLDATAEREVDLYNTISGYNDGHGVGAPVDELWTNPWKLAGVGGNVWEMCASDSTGVSFGAWRGASWFISRQADMRCSSRGVGGAARRGHYYGFRLVLSR